MGFFDRNREDVVKRGYDANRLPSGQYLTERFPVLHVGDVPTYKPGEWNLKVFGAVNNEFTLTFDELKSMPSTTLTTDIHCVTKWSKFDTVWRGVKVRDLFERAG
ncbi:MAG: molybdopterin-dependent oxidoreductase, partial [Ilumatobacteraceae bacterium]